MYTTHMTAKLNTESKYVIERQVDALSPRLDKLMELTETQCNDGNWDYDHYNHGLANGLILAVHILQDMDGSPPYLSAPNEWKSSKYADFRDT
mgnify:FL=1